ncbi:nondiscriminating glutamyl-tRNA synthetase EARS2, mitochondrial-like [Watersipora subatra]|uniref:nondiscriminating glutamyl-tRNA synthetase EARS2, mitochondrial-like n=1 Tax=Watersipora subatra TaxID=2589382 RepID=UPI00355C97B9
MILLSIKPLQNGFVCGGAPFLTFSKPVKTLRRFSSCANGHRNVERSLVNNISNKSTVVRVRFAPSPTGELHLGGLRTALYNFLYARQHNGVFILRCEDTDQARYVPGAMERIIDLLSWVGIKPDEGPIIGGDYGPYVQSERLALYTKWVNQLLEEGHAYKCFCSPQRLELLRKEQSMRREVFQGYDNACRYLTHEKLQEKVSSKTPFVVRFKLMDCAQTWTDMVHGDCRADLRNAEGDPIILKTDGYPTYHLANVIDDHYMKISHVLRGTEWHTSTAKHLQLFAAFGWTPPRYAHLPLLLNEDGTKLSKRQDSMQLQHLKDCGYDPESLISLLSLAGGGIVLPHSDVSTHGVSLTTAIKHFILENTRTESTVLEVGRLPSLSQSYLKRKYDQESEDLFSLRIREIATLKGLETWNIKHLYKHFPSCVDRLSTINSLFEDDFLYIWQRPSDDLKFDRLKIASSVCITALSQLKSSLSSHSHTNYDELVNSIQKKSGLKKATMFKILRVALTGHEVGLPVTLILQLLGQHETITRCDLALQVLNR